MIRLLFTLWLTSSLAQASQQIFSDIQGAGSFGSAVCAIDRAQGLLCWGMPDDVTQELRKIKKPYLLSNSSGRGLCVAHESGLTCIHASYNGTSINGDAYNLETFPILQIDRLSANGQSWCASTLAGVICSPDTGIKIPLEYSHPKFLALGRVNACLVKDNRYQCFGQGFGVSPWPPVGVRPFAITHFEYSEPSPWDQDKFCGFGEGLQECFGTYSNNSAQSTQFAHVKEIDGPWIWMESGQINGLIRWNELSNDRTFKPEIKNVRGILAVAGGVCAYSQNLFECTGATASPPATPLHGVRDYVMIAPATGTFPGLASLVLDDEGFRSLNSESVLFTTTHPRLGPVPNAYSAKYASDIGCYLDSGKPKCFGKNENFPKLDDIKDVKDYFLLSNTYTRTDFGFCWTDGLQVRCRGPKEQTYPALAGANAILNTQIGVCAAVGKKMICENAEGEITGDETFSDEIVRIDQIEYSTLAVLDRSGDYTSFKSWGKKLSQRQRVATGIKDAFKLVDVFAKFNFLNMALVKNDGTLRIFKYMGYGDPEEVAAPSLSNPSNLQVWGDTVFALDHGEIRSWTYTDKTHFTLKTY